ncbi:hypothetical protein [Aurantivibrio plasticivorans]
MPDDAKPSKNLIWCSSKEAKKALKISDCELMHMRVAGKLVFEKRGNAFFYLIDKSKVVDSA